MTLDSTDAEQEPADQQVDSPEDGQEDARSGIDNSGGDSGSRLNGLMRLVGKRTTEVSQQKARADQAEAALAEATQRLAAYEDGAAMGDASALEALVQQGESQDTAADIETDEPDEGNSGFDYWAGPFYGPTGEPAATRVDPNSVSRAQAGRTMHLSEAQRLRGDFDRGLDQALTTWGVEQH